MLLHEDAGPEDALAGYYYAYRSSLIHANMAGGGAESEWLESMDAAARARASVEAALDDAMDGDADGEDGAGRFATMCGAIAGWDTERVLLKDEGWRFTALTFEAGGEEEGEEDGKDE